MKFKTIKISNFQSLGDITYNLNTHGLILIDGYNHDLNSFNGAGKSAFLNALTYSIYGKTPKEINLNELIREGTNKMSTDIELEINNQNIQIVRERTTKSSKLTTFINGNEVKGSIKQLEEKIKELITFTFEQFIQIIYIYQNSNNRFITLNDTEKKNFLTKLLNLEMYDEAYKKVHNELSQSEIQLAQITGQLSVFTAETETLNRQIEETQKCILIYQQELNNLEDAIKAKAIIVKQELEQLEKDKIILQNNSRLAELEAQKEDVIAQLNKIKMTQKTITDLKYNHKDTQKIIEQLKQYQEQLSQSTCPTCKQSWIDESKNNKINDTKTKIIETQNKQKELENQIIISEELLSKNNEEDCHKLYESILQSIAKEKSQGVQFINQQISLKQQELKNLSLSITNAHFKVDSTQGNLAKLQQKKENSNQSVINLVQKESVIKLAQNNLIELKKVFSPTGIKAYVFENIIKQLNFYIEKYLNILTSGLFKLEYQTDEAKGKFIELLEYMGKNRSINSLSGGELRRISLAVDLALSDTICAKVSAYPNILFLDEAFEGLDQIGREAVMSLLNELIHNKDAIYIIDHASEMKSAFTNTLKIVKRNGESTLE